MGARGRPGGGGGGVGVEGGDNLGPGGWRVQTINFGQYHQGPQS